jgi:hypothetical protein
MNAINQRRPAEMARLGLYPRHVRTSVARISYKAALSATAFAAFSQRKPHGLAQHHQPRQEIRDTWAENDGRSPPQFFVQDQHVVPRPEIYLEIPLNADAEIGYHHLKAKVNCEDLGSAGGVQLPDAERGENKKQKKSAGRIPIDCRLCPDEIRKNQGD